MSGLRAEIDCPNCTSNAGTTVSDTRGSYKFGFQTIRRRRKCLGCGWGYATYEFNVDHLKAFLKEYEIFESFCSMIARRANDVRE